MGKTGITLLGISGSPRLKSTHYAVNEALDYARERHDVETDYFSVHNKTIGFCMHCDYCVPVSYTHLTLPTIYSV